MVEQLRREGIVTRRTHVLRVQAYEQDWKGIGHYCLVGAMFLEQLGALGQ